MRDRKERYIEIEWERNGDAYAALKESRYTSVYPWIVQECTAIKPKAILDFGGGSGDLAKLIAAATHSSVRIFEPNTTMRKCAQDRTEGTDIITVSTREELENFRFDVIVFCAVWMCLATFDECVDSLRWMRSRLSEAGVIIYAVTHPCFRAWHFSTFRTDFDMANYLQAGTRFSAFVGDANQTVVVKDTHWPLEAMYLQAAAAGLRFGKIAELADIDSLGNKIHRPPPWLVGTLTQSK